MADLADFLANFARVPRCTLFLVPLPRKPVSAGRLGDWQVFARALPFDAVDVQALDCDFYLRIALELHLKRCLVGGMDRVFEIGRVFRNEGVSVKHSPEFTMLEAYQAYTDYRGMMELVRSMIQKVCVDVLGTTSVLRPDGVAIELGGELRFEDLTPRLLRGYVKRSIPVISGLSASYLYRTPREYGPNCDYDDVRGEPTGHFVVLCGYNKETRPIQIADPLLPNPVAQSQLYDVGIDRLLNAILLGVLTYDANLLIIRPRRKKLIHA